MCRCWTSEEILASNGSLQTPGDCWHPCPHTGSGRNLPLFPVHANPNTEACKMPVHFLQTHLLFPSFCDCPPWQREQPCSKRNQWALESPAPEGSRAIGSKEVETICFPLSEGYCTRGGMHEHCYSAKSYIQIAQATGTEYFYKSCTPSMHITPRIHMHLCTG